MATKIGVIDESMLLDSHGVNVIVGSNGAGKTRFLDALASAVAQGTSRKRNMGSDSGAGRSDIGSSGADSGDAGIVSVRALIEMAVDGRQCASGLAYQLQDPMCLPTLSVRQTIALYKAMNACLPGNAESSTQLACQSVGAELRRLRDAKAGMLSGGELKLLMAYCTCLLDRCVYLLDEPTAGVDAVHARQMLKMLADLSRVHRRCVIVTLHQMDQIDLLGDPYIVVLGKTGMVRQGRYSALTAGYECCAGVSVFAWLTRAQ